MDQKVIERARKRALKALGLDKRQNLTRDDVRDAMVRLFADLSHLADALGNFPRWYEEYDKAFEYENMWVAGNGVKRDETSPNTFATQEEADARRTSDRIEALRFRTEHNIR
jgi:predicted metal-dependent HD superfamily phosphohydrolase